MTEHSLVRHLPPEPTPYPTELVGIKVENDDGSTASPPTIHQAMAAVMESVSPVGKTGVNKEQGYNFRSIDKFMDALNPAMAEHGVHVVPRVLTRLVEERTTRNGAYLRCVDLEVAFTFYGPAGDSVVGISWGEGTDTGDKATNKAMTGAFKYAIVQVFMVPTSDLADADLTSPEVASRAEQAQHEQAQADASPEVVAELRARALDISQQPKPDRAKALTALWKDAQKARALGATVLVPKGWQALVGEEHLVLHQLVTGVRETDQLPAHGEGMALGEQADPATGEVQPPAAADVANQPRCTATRDSDGGRCEKADGHTGRHSYLAPTGAAPEPDPVDEKIADALATAAAEQAELGKP